jgi:hypothetical protein
LHTALVTHEFLAKNKITTMDHPPYLPDLAPCDFCLFPKVKNITRGEHFVDVDTIKLETTKLLKELTKRTCSTAFKNGRSVGPSAFCQGESTSRVTTFPFQNNLIWIFGEPSARTFCTHLVQSLLLHNTCAVHDIIYCFKSVEKSKRLKGKVTLQPAMKAQGWGRGIALPIHNLSTRRVWVISTTPRPLYPWRETLYPLYRRLGGPQGWSG